MLKQRMQTYNDGVCRIFNVENTAPAGFRPKERLILKDGPLRYAERIVGATRFYQAKAAQERVDMVVRVPRRAGIAVDQVAVLKDGRQYQIKQVQHPPDVLPPSTDLSLEAVRTEDAYDLG